ncbi:unnamed protein product, partial [Rotaria sp. Silwood2]
MWNNKITILLIFLAIQGIFGEQCLNDQWPPKPERAVPTYVVNLDDPPMERWNQVATAFKSEIIDILAFFKAYIVEISPNLKFLLELIDDKLPALADTLPAPYGDEMKGISQATGLPLGIHIHMQISLPYWDMSNNTWILTEKLRTLITQINFTRNGEVLFKTTSVLTGLKPNAFSVSVNSRTSFQGGYEGLIEWIFNINRNQSFITFALRDMLTKAESFDVVVNYLAETELLAPCYYIVGGPKPEQGVVITRERTKAVNITRMELTMATYTTSVDTQDRLLESPMRETSINTVKSIPISTRYGYVLVTQQGASDRPVIVTYHDVGYNSATQFHHFFAFPEMIPITEHFTIYHINAPGQEDRANPLPSTSVYPTMEQLAETVNDVFNHLDIKTAVGFGVGVGANILTRFALKYSTKIYGLILVNCISRGIGWFEGFTLKWPTQDMPQQAWTDALLTYLIWYHLGYESQSAHPDLVQGLRRHLEENVNAKNVVKLLNSFLKRTPILMERPNELNKNANPPISLKCNIINITGFSSPHKDDVIDTNDKCDPAKSSYVEFADCGGALLEEQPAKTAEAIRLFLQGLGYISHLSIPKFSIANRLTE